MSAKSWKGVKFSPQTKATKPLIEPASASKGAVRQYLSFSFKYLDPNQGQSLEDWSNVGLLLPLNERLKALSTMAPHEIFNNKKAKRYPAFPPKDKTLFVYPKHVSEDADWCVVHIGNKEVIVGHLVGSVFYIVFLDKDHQFWLSNKKHT